MVLRFRNRRFPERANRAAQGLVIQARAIVGDTEDTVVSVSEHDCGICSRFFKVRACFP